MSKPMKVDLSILKKLVENLEKGLASAEALKSSETATMSDYIVEMSKAAGLVAGIMQEGSMLIGDIQSMVKTIQAPAPKSNSDFLEKLLGGIKGGGNTAN